MADCESHLSSLLGPTQHLQAVRGDPADNAAHGTAEDGSSDPARDRRVGCRNSSHSARLPRGPPHSFYSVRHRRRCRPAHLLCPARHPQVVISSTFQTVRSPTAQRPRSPSPRLQRRSTSSVSLPRTSAQPGPLGQASARAADRVVAKNSCLTPWTVTARRTSASVVNQRSLP
jgi:hypothetical protein